MGTQGGTVREIFPDEIITEILTRLPAKSLLRFRCVSKSWLALISNPAFIRAHLNSGISNTSYSRHLLICISADPTSRFREFPLRFLLRDQAAASDSVASDGYDLANPDMPMWIVGSCRGMVCVSLDEENLVLWNPSIGKHKRLPYIQIGPGSGCYMKDGFGYDEPNDDYKVVAIFLSIFQNGPYRVMMFSLRANRWRRVEDFRHGTPLDNSGKYSNGKLHWLVNCEGRMGIVSLDLSSERYGEMGLPRNSDISTCCCTITELDDPCVTLGLFAGGLCLMFDDHRACMHLWVMKEYGVRDSWARVLVMPHMGSPGFYPHMLRAWVLNGGEILFLYGCVVVVYDPRGDRYRYPPIDDIGAIVQADVYVESLVSPSD